MTTMSILPLVVGIMAAVLVVMFAVKMSNRWFENAKRGIDYFMSSTSMWFDNDKFSAGAAC